MRASSWWRWDTEDCVCDGEYIDGSRSEPALSFSPGISSLNACSEEMSVDVNSIKLCHVRSFSRVSLRFCVNQG